MFGFELDFRDYATFVAILLALVAVTAVLLWLAGLPGRMAIARKYPDAEAVKMVFDGADQSKFPIDAQGAAAICTGGMHGGWTALRRIGIRTYSWLNWLYPVPF